MSRARIPAVVLPVIDGAKDVPSLVEALRYLEAMPDMPDAAVTAWCKAEARILSALAAARPRTPSEVALKAEVAVRHLLAALEDGEMVEDVELGRSVLRDIREREPISELARANAKQADVRRVSS